MAGDTIEARLHIPADALEKVRPLLGGIAVAFGVEVSYGPYPDTITEAVGETVRYQYNPDRVVWMQDSTSGAPVAVVTQDILKAYPAAPSYVRNRLANALWDGARQAISPDAYPGDQKLLPYFLVGEAGVVCGLRADKLEWLVRDSRTLEGVKQVGEKGMDFLRAFCADLYEKAES